MQKSFSKDKAADMLLRKVAQAGARVGHAAAQNCAGIHQRVKYSHLAFSIETMIVNFTIASQVAGLKVSFTTNEYIQGVIPSKFHPLVLVQRENRLSI